MLHHNADYNPGSQAPKAHGSLSGFPSDASSVSRSSIERIVDAETVLPATDQQQNKLDAAPLSTSPPDFDVAKLDRQTASTDELDDSEMFSHFPDDEISDSDSSSAQGLFDEPIVDLGDFNNVKLGAGERYHITGFIGHGGMANVYNAIDRNRNHVEVAVKVPLAKYLSTDSLRERFQREARALIALEHPNICRVIDTGQYHNTPYVVLQKLAGGNLRDHYETSAIANIEQTCDVLFNWLIPIAEALDFIHAHGYIHRDVKPDNILFDEHGHAYLSDFGIARVVGDQGDLSSHPLTQFESWMGTPGYVAPEIGTSYSLDGRCDQYSLACVVYYCLTKTLPFPGKTPTEYRASQATMDPVALSEFNASIPASVTLVMERAFSTSPEDRYDNCREFADALRSAFEIPKSLQTLHSEERDDQLVRPRLLKTASLGLVACLAVSVAFYLRSNETTADALHTQPVSEASIPHSNTSAEPVTQSTNANQNRANRSSDDLQQAPPPPENTTPEEDAAATTQPGKLGQTKTVSTREELALIDYDNALKYSAAGEEEAALDSLNLAIQRDPTRPEFYASRGFSLAKINRHADALSQFTNAITRASDTPHEIVASWYSARAAVQTHLGKPLAAIDDMTDAIKLLPENPRNYRRRAALYRQIDEPQKASVDITMAESLEAEPGP